MKKHTIGHMPFASVKGFKSVFFWSAVGGILIGSPLIGCLLQGKPLSPYLRFPPRTQPLDHAAFSQTIFLLFVFIDLLMAGAVALFFTKGFQSTRRPLFSASKAFPPWGWAGGVILAGGWLLAWTRFPWFAPFQEHTFSLPWIGYIMATNAICLARSNRSLMTDTPLGFAMLFPISAVFWWFFEYLNRFVQNWRYVGVSDFSPLAYTLFASLAFATVLPAVLSTYRLLLTFDIFSKPRALKTRSAKARPKTAGVILLLTSWASLVMLAPFHNQLFAVVWVAPFLLIQALQLLTGRPALLATIWRGDWRPAVAAALAALVCGFFWEMWNMGSLARWVYTVPYVNRFLLFEMPIVGYGGYLPFGLECLVVGHIVLGDRSMALSMGFPDAENAGRRSWPE